MNIKHNQFNTEKANKIKIISKRTVAIINMLAKGEDERDIIKELRCERSLVHYYLRILTNAK